MKLRCFIAALLFACPAYAQVSVRNGVSSDQVNKFLQQMQGALATGQVPGMTPQQQTNLQRGLVVGKIYNCTEQAVGKPALDAYMREMKATGQQIEAYCKQGQPEQAKTLALTTFKAKVNDPVSVAAKDCYYQNKAEITPLLKPDQQTDAVKYERWADHPEFAENEATSHDICKGSPQVAAVPVQPITTQATQDIQ